MYVMVSQLYKQPDAAGMQNELLCIIVDYPRVGAPRCHFQEFAPAYASRSFYHIDFETDHMYRADAQCCTCAMLVLQL